MSIFEDDLTHYQSNYNLHTSVWDYLDSVLKIIGEKDIMQAEDLYNLIDHSKLGCNGRVCERAVLFLQKKVRKLLFIELSMN